MYHTYLSRLTAALACLCAASVICYGIFLLMAVSHTAARTQAQRDVMRMTAKLGDMEMHYLSQQRALTPERAAALGFVKPHTTVTVHTASGPSLSLNTQR